MNHIRPRLQHSSLPSGAFSTHDPFQSHLSHPPSLGPSTASMGAVRLNALHHSPQQAAQPSYLFNLPHIQNSSILAQNYRGQIPTSQTSQSLPFQTSLTTHPQQQQRPHTSSGNGKRTQALNNTWVVVSVLLFQTFSLSLSLSFPLRFERVSVRGGVVIIIITQQPGECTTNTGISSATSPKRFRD